MPEMIELIAFDADDTLWHNEIHYRNTEAKFQQILAPYRLDGQASGMLATPVELLDHVPSVVAALSTSHPIMLITKGDLLDQERKLAQSGLAPYFDHVEIVSHKTPEVYRSVLDKHQIAPQRFLMVGNSLRSDVAPVVALGGQAVHIPYQITWAHESQLDEHNAGNEYTQLDHIGLLPALVEQLGQKREGSDGRGG
jgi:putative hydrolase of the HAD superfamily